MFKTLRKTTWNKIKVGEVFAFNCTGWSIFQKSAEDEVILLTESTQDNRADLGLRRNPRTKEPYAIGYKWDRFFEVYAEDRHYLYKLPITVQRLWGC